MNTKSLSHEEVMVRIRSARAEFNEATLMADSQDFYNLPRTITNEQLNALRQKLEDAKHYPL